MRENYCIIFGCGGELREVTQSTEYGSYGTGDFYCQNCGIKYEFIPPKHLQQRPLPPAEKK